MLRKENKPGGHFTQNLNKLNFVVDFENLRYANCLDDTYVRLDDTNIRLDKLHIRLDKLHIRLDKLHIKPDTNEIEKCPLYFKGNASFDFSNIGPGQQQTGAGTAAFRNSGTNTIISSSDANFLVHIRL